MLEFTEKFNKPELFLKEFEHWVIILRERVVTLGSCVIILKSGKPNLKDTSKEEMAELPKVCEWFENKTKKLYSAEKWNYMALMMNDEFVHFHAIPRYSKEVNMYDMTWVDEDWPRIKSLKPLEVPKEVFNKIKEDMIKEEHNAEDN